MDFTFLFLFNFMSTLVLKFHKYSSPCKFDILSNAVNSCMIFFIVLSDRETDLPSEPQYAMSNEDSQDPIHYSSPTLPSSPVFSAISTALSPQTDPSPAQPSNLQLSDNADFKALFSE